MIRSPLLLLAALSACGMKLNNRPPDFDGTQAFQAIEAAKGVSALKQVFVVCGPSAGKGLYAQTYGKGLVDDGIKSGRIVFALREDGEFDILSRDATGSFTSAVDDVGTVRRLVSNSGQEGWSVYYPQTGVAENHNITQTNDNRFVDIWTSSKPDSMVGAAAKLFQAQCVTNS